MNLARAVPVFIVLFVATAAGALAHPAAQPNEWPWQGAAAQGEWPWQLGGAQLPPPHG